MPDHDTFPNPWAEVATAGLTVAAASAHLMVSTATQSMSLWARLLSPGDRSDAEHATPPPSRSERVRSWYRPPYRSPFDPMFWLTPGHPVDHMALWFPTEAQRFSMPGSGWPFQVSPQQFWAWWMLAVAMTPSTPQRALADASNVVDFVSAFAAYRTAGGHAVAQIRRSEAPDPRDAAAGAATFWAWPLMFFPTSPR